MPLPTPSPYRVAVDAHRAMATAGTAALEAVALPMAVYLIAPTVASTFGASWVALLALQKASMVAMVVGLLVVSHSVQRSVLGHPATGLRKTLASRGFWAFSLSVLILLVSLCAFVAVETWWVSALMADLFPRGSYHRSSDAEPWVGFTLATSAFLLVLFLTTRFSLALPLAADTSRIQIVHAWKQTRGSVCRTVATIALTAIPVVAASLAVMFLDLEARDAAMESRALSFLLCTSLGVFATAVLSASLALVHANMRGLPVVAAAAPLADAAPEPMAPPALA